MKHLDALEARRRALLARCGEQRADLAYRMSQLAPRTQLAHWTNRAAHWTNLSPKSPLNSPIAWLAGGAALVMLFFRPGRIISRLAWITTTVSLLSRATRLMRVVASLRSAFR